jgi:hypothetical protein
MKLSLTIDVTADAPPSSAACDAAAFENWNIEKHPPVHHSANFVTQVAAPFLDSPHRRRKPADVIRAYNAELQFDSEPLGHIISRRT